MFLAMNRFKIVSGKEEVFEKIWRERDSHLEDVDGFVEFNLLKGKSSEAFTFYASHSIWKSKKHFEAWTRSESFKLAHRNAGKHRDIYLGPPELETLEKVL